MPRSPDTTTAGAASKEQLNRDAHAFQPQLQISAPLPSSLCTALPALLWVLFVVISPQQLGCRAGGAGWAQHQRQGGHSPWCQLTRGEEKPLAPASRPSPLPLLQHRRVTALLQATDLPRCPPVQVLGGPQATPPCQEGHNTILPEEPPPESPPPSATGS